ncbi:hypothetical protein ACFCP7_05065, partial [Paenibacillus elgii]
TVERGRMMSNLGNHSPSKPKTVFLEPHQRLLLVFSFTDMRNVGFKMKKCLKINVSRISTKGAECEL